MSNIFAKILLISLFLRLSTSLDCHVCSKDYNPSEFLTPEEIEAAKETMEEIEKYIEEVENGKVDAEAIEAKCTDL